MKQLWIFLLALSFSVSSNAEKVVNLTNGEWPPHLSEHLKENGFASAIVREAFAAVGINVNYGYFPWKRSYYLAQNGIHKSGAVWQGSVIWLYTKDRADFFYYSDPVLTENGVLYHLKSNPLSWTSIEDLRGMVLGGTAHTSYEVLEEAESHYILSIDRAGNYDVLFDRLLAKRIDAIPHVKSVADYFLYTKYPKEIRDKITYSPTAYDSRVYHLILNRKNPEHKKLIREFNKGLQIIKDNGTYEQLLRKLEDGYFYHQN